MLQLFQRTHLLEDVVLIRRVKPAKCLQRFLELGGRGGRFFKNGLFAGKKILRAHMENLADVIEKKPVGLDAAVFQIAYDIPAHAEFFAEAALRKMEHRAHGFDS